MWQTYIYFHAKLVLHWWTGHCHFTLTPRASVTAYNNLIKIDISKEDCLELCRTTRDFDCRSVEVHTTFDVCQLSAESRWSQPRAFGTSDRDWDYYHWTCINGGTCWCCLNLMTWPLAYATDVTHTLTCTSDLPCGPHVTLVLWSRLLLILWAARTSYVLWHVNGLYSCVNIYLTSFAVHVTEADW